MMEEAIKIKMNTADEQQEYKLNEKDLKKEKTVKNDDLMAKVMAIAQKKKAPTGVITPPKRIGTTKELLKAPKLALMNKAGSMILD